MDIMIPALVGAASGAIGAGVWLRLKVGGPATAGRADIDVDAAEPESPLRVADAREHLYGMAVALEPVYDRIAHPDDLLEHPGVQRAVQLLVDGPFDEDDLLAYFGGSNSVLTTLSSIALAERTEVADGLADRVLAAFDNANAYARHFALRALERRVEGPLLGLILACLDDSWNRYWPRRFLNEFVRRRVAAGDTDIAASQAESIDEDERGWVIEVLRECGAVPAAERIAALDRDQVDTDFFTAVGKVWSVADSSSVVRDSAIDLRVEELRGQVLAPRPRGVVLVGERGVGKTTTLKLLGESLLEDGWTLFEAGAVEILAGQIYIGELEQRVRDLLANLCDRPHVLWIVPDLEELSSAGRHRFSTTSVLDMIWPVLETGRLRLVAEVTSDGLERLLREEPRLRTALTLVRVEPTRDDETVELGRRWARHVVGEGLPPACPDDVVAEAQQLAQQFLGRSAQPGGLLELLTHTRESRAAVGVDGPFELDDVLASLSRMSGLPRTVVDERESLDLDALESMFRERVVGQPEAVACLVDRVAMVKAGLTDPNRPLGVFLFTGPTGTGKTEIAKTLATFLFGSAERMLRLDMSEFQSLDSLGRLLGDREERPGSTALVHEIRRQPFAVVLLDEVEKAHTAIHDLFLQVFDDGRLTDRRGRTADFRHAIVIMTSNVGAIATRGAAMTFGAGRSVTGVDPTVEKSLLAEFRPEFLNRIDRTVVFRSLDRADMRRVLDKELRGVLERRGLRNRQWAVEWDESATTFLLERGFSPEMGARPLRRTIERYLLAPLAKTIAQQRAPSGDQFLFVRSDGHRLQVEFVDPDAPDEAPRPEPVEVEERGVGRIAFEPRGTAAEVELLRDRFTEVRGRVSGDDWATRKKAALDAMAEPEFWASDDRWPVLARAEYMDRIGVGLDTAERLLGRLSDRGGRSRPRPPRDLIGRLAERLHLLTQAIDGLAAGSPADAFLRVEALLEGQVDPASVNGAARRIAAMYRGWASSRQMELDELDERSGDGPYRLEIGVVGFGAFPILVDEGGLHVFEVKGPDGEVVDRLRVRVTVAPQPEDSAPGDHDVRARRARRALSAVGEHRTRIARRYRDAPSPLVRDALRGWRTGRLDRVLAGDFDLL